MKVYIHKVRQGGEDPRSRIGDQVLGVYRNLDVAKAAKAERDTTPVNGMDDLRSFDIGTSWIEESEIQ